MFASANRIVRAAAAFALVAMVAGGCSRDTSSPYEPTATAEVAPVSGAMLGFVSNQVIINHYQVQFDGRTVANGKTTFSYTVRGTGVDPSLTHFSVELPTCAGSPASYTPTGGANINTNQSSGIYGLEWHLNVPKDPTQPRAYSITFNGDVALGIVRAEVKTEGGTSAVGYVYGPCAGSHVTGKVFVDADESGTLNNAEAGIANVTVMISDGGNSVATKTDASGNYTFLVANGNYTVSVPAATAAADFNEDLAASFTATSSASSSITVNGDSNGNNFAFAPQTQQLIQKISLGELAASGQSTKFWKSEMKFAATGGGQHTYSLAQLQQLLAQIEAFGLATPFQFTDGNEAQDALAILSVNGKNDYLGLFLKELLAAELNYFSGNTLVGEADLHEVLVLWGEEVAVQPLAPASSRELIVNGGNAGGGTKLNPYEGGTTLLGLLNGSTGGGGGDE
jgi:hypothetical protein